MIDLIIFTIAAYSLTFGIIESPNKFIKIFRSKVKQYLSEKLIICYHCSGFWLSLFLSPYLLNRLNLSFFHAPLLALYGGGMIYLIHIGEDYIFNLTVNLKVKNDDRRKT